MKKAIYLLLILIAAAGLTACNTQQDVEDPTENKEVGTPADDDTAKEPAQEDSVKEDTEKKEEADKEDSAAKEEPAQEDAKQEENAGENSSDSSDQSDDVNKEESKAYENDAFKEVVVKDAGDKFKITGKARVFEGQFEYRISEGDKVLKEDHYQTEGAPAWGDFTIEFKKDLISGNEASVKLFVLSAKDASEVDVLDIPIKK